MTAPRHIVVMGVSGSGKSTVGRLLAERLDLPFRDGDELHPVENIEKMASGVPLVDDDRWPWLRRVGAWLAERPAGGIIGCSALKRSYRDLIREYSPDAVFVHVHGSPELLRSRMRTRPGHFMPATLLESQLALLEPLEADEVGREFDVTDSPVEVVADAAEWLLAVGDE